MSYAYFVSVSGLGFAPYTLPDGYLSDARARGVGEAEVAKHNGNARYSIQRRRIRDNDRRFN